MIPTVNEMEIFTSADNQVEVLVKFDDTDTIGDQIKNIYAEFELDDVQLPSFSR